MSKKNRLNLLKKIHGGQVSQIIATCSRLKLCDMLYKEPLTLSTLAEKLGIHSSLLHRFLLALIQLNIIDAKGNEIYQLTEEGRLLATNHPNSLAPISLFKGSHMLWEANQCLEEGLKSGLAPFELAHGEPLFDYLEKHPSDFHIFHNAMRFYEENSSKIILEACDFESFSSLLDVGCGMGTFLSSIALLAPNLTTTGFDLPSVIRGARSYSPDHQYIAGSFFNEVPAGYDLYILRNIIHDWADEECVQILDRVRLAMKPDSKLRLFETITKEEEESHMGRFSDINMYVLTGEGKERTYSQVESLIKRAGLRICHSITPPGTSKTMIELSKV